MASFTHSFETVSDNGGSLLSSFKTVSIDIPTPNFPKTWQDEVGSSVYRDTDFNSKKFVKNLEDAFRYLIELDKSFQADKFNIDINSIENAIHSLKVK